MRLHLTVGRSRSPSVYDLSETVYEVVPDGPKSFRASDPPLNHSLAEKFRSDERTGWSVGAAQRGGDMFCARRAINQNRQFPGIHGSIQIVGM